MQTKKQQPKDNLISRAMMEVKGFAAFHEQFKQKICITGKSLDTYNNYGAHLAKITLHFKRLPTDLSMAEIEDYLYYIKQKYNTASDSYFKFAVYSLRFLFKMTGEDFKRISLPELKGPRKLPVVLSKEEIVNLMNKPMLLKHRILIALMYGCGLRSLEARSIQLCDIDFDRLVLHVRQGKGRKDRYVPLGKALASELRHYIRVHNPQVWLFNGRPEGPDNRYGGDFCRRYTQSGVRFVISQAAKRAGIIKHINIHTLRHTFATHLLEDGLDIVSIKELLGHARIDTTLVYLHVAQINKKNNFSPIDNLKGLKLTDGVQHCLEFDNPN